MTPGDTFRGLRVLDLGTNIAAPYAALILADLGAEVIKIERAPGGDDTRALPPRWGEESTVFMTMNRGKKSVLLDLKTEVGRHAVLKLAEGADIAIESFPPGVAAKLGLTYEAFSAHNPELVLCTVSAFGDGPLGSAMPGYDALVQAVSGLMSLTGHADSEPVRVGPSILDVSTGMWGAIGIMAALHRRASGAGGAHVQASLIDSAFALAGHQIQGLLATGQHPPKLGSGAPSAAPYRVYRARDDFIMIATASEPQFPRLCEVLGVPALAADARFRTMADRLAHRDALDAQIGTIVAERNIDDLLAALAGANISAGRVNSLGEALNTLVARERELLIAPGRSGLPAQRTPAVPPGHPVGEAAPRLGEHSREVLAQAGLSREIIQALTRG